jgi:nicotinamide mononucleotide (NMN) deamidase PncC
MSIDPSNNAKPKIVDELYDTGLIIAEAGPGTKTYMRVDDPGVYFDAQQRPVSERDAARAGFNVQYWRSERRAKAIKDAAEQHAQRIRAEGQAFMQQALVSPNEELRAKANRLAAEWLKAHGESNRHDAEMARQVRKAAHKIAHI